MPPAAAWEGSAGRGFASARISFAVFAHGAFPAEMHHAQKLQKIFPVAEGDHAQGPSCSVEREYCPHCLKSHRAKNKGECRGDEVPSAGVWGTLSGGQCEGAPAFPPKSPSRMQSQGKKVLHVQLNR